MLSSEETKRYARHLVLKGIGGQGQQKLKAASVLVIGAGGLGSPAIAYLAAAGVGRVGVVDDDTVSLSNLQRQIVHRTEDNGRTKAESAGDFVAALNPHVEFVSHELRLDAGNAGEIVAGYQLVLDGSDNFDTRLAVAEAAEAARIPLVSGAVSMFDGQVTVFAPHLARPNGKANPRFRELYPETPDEADLPSCEAVGVLGPVTGVIGTLMAMEAIKLITGTGEPLLGRLLLYDGRAARFTELKY
ncbi:MAG TPA: molybdopterin-synthase adenylyltransferase MoeB [Devosiaceae bacterium]|jgi:molybdopterin/thiamine biosynthesis adenylyltransferase|nr:molybdopterin-synthase adenylyltransferase MoeB [Devosiaceae bacterium]